MLKKINIIIIGLLFLTIGCSDEFLNVNNTNTLSESSFYITEQDFEDLLITCYMPLGHMQQGTGQHTIGFAIDDRILHEQVNTSLLQFTSSNENIANIYRALYTGVFRSNLFIQKFTDEIDVDEERRKTMLGEANFFRGLYYFYLATWFEVPPLVTEPAEDPRVGYPNATQEEVYAFVEESFLKAIEMLPENWSSTQTGRATKGAAMAFLGKTYLLQSKFNKSAEVLGSLINSNSYQLNMPVGTDSLDYIYAYLSNFTSIDMEHSGHSYQSEFNSESIFEINYSLASDVGPSSQYLILRRSTGGHITWFNGPSSITGGFGNVAAEDTKFVDEFELTPNHPAGLKRDPRYYAFYIELGDQLDPRSDHPLFGETFAVSDINSSVGSKKGLRKGLYPYHTSYTWPNAPFQDPNNWRLMRYAEVLLMYAEATIRNTGDMTNSSALDAVNQIRNRAGVEELTVLSKEAIIHERDIELCGEHKRFWDLGRWYTDGWLTLSEVQQFKPTFQPRHVSFPIPLSEINRHYGVLKQNPNW
ncbi:MAG: RagB/SusD family nutrient uptake outer membrane protein [Saprospiraceae bacterium]